MNMNLHDVACAIGACGDFSEASSITKVCIDSRSVQSGDLFFCIVGQKMDGHQFASQAVSKGACAVIASTPLELSVPVLLVRDTTVALGKLARAWREQSKAKVIGVTGSAGKTTVKEMLAQVMATAGVTAKNFKNLNNQIGLPLSILEMSGKEEYWVLELGISRPGDMDDLGVILAPDVGVILNIGPCHLDGLGDLAGVAREKSILLEYVRKDGFGCVNADYAPLVDESKKRTLRTVYFSGQALEVEYSCAGHSEQPGGKLEYTIRVAGHEHVLSASANVRVAENVACVVAVALELGIKFPEIACGLSTYAPVAQRFVQAQIGSWIFIDDTYNANPVSMARSISEARRIAQNKPLVLVLADMRELGAESISAHRELGRLIAENGCRYCFFNGKHADDVRTGLLGSDVVFQEVKSADEVLSALAPMRSLSGVMLFKGSRSCKMENYYTFMERSWA